jgi:hypothetical protein
VDSWKKPIGPDWFAKPTSPRTSGFSCSRLSLHCSRACAAETRSAHSRSLLHDCRARLHLRCAAFALLPHQRPPICLRVVCCLARAHAYGIEPSRPPVEHSRSHPRTRQSNSARTSAFASPPFLPARHAITATSVSARAMVCSHLATSKSSTNSSQCCLTSSAASSSTVSDVLHARLHCFPHVGPRRVVTPRHREP